MKSQSNKKLVLNKETLQLLSDDALSRVAGGDSTGASAGQSCECTYHCPTYVQYLTCKEPGLKQTWE